MRPFKDHSCSRRIFKVSLPHHCLPQDDRKYVEEVTKRTLPSVWKKLWLESVVKCVFESFERVPVQPVINEIVSLAKVMGLELDNNDNEFVEEHSQELTIKEFTEFHSKVMWRREILKA
ncbi:hypothetical protein AVEN_216927-1 [Araneus ventricosus]|uniref:Uncharacterized protein n=1 Tax=Araneus ventricosus TaxID=182803 RepID=A0A4Y2S8H3_ARAVE|nr:hypothetical protein AVEN_216927-1 [Araneus ventricosus]